MKFMQANVCLFDDIDTLHKSDEGLLKSMVSMEKGLIRQSYAREGKLWLRRGICMGTSNNMEVIPFDPTGNTRFVALKVMEMQDWEWLDENRAQLFAEAVAMRAAPEIDFTVMEEHIEHDALYDAAAEWVELFLAGDKEVMALCPRSAAGISYFRAESFWFWHKKGAYNPNMVESKRLTAYLKALGLEYKGKSSVRFGDKTMKYCFCAPCAPT